MTLDGGEPFSLPRTTLSHGEALQHIQFGKNFALVTDQARLTRVRADVQWTSPPNPAPKLIWTRNSQALQGPWTAAGRSDPASDFAEWR